MERAGLTGSSAEPFHGTSLHEFSDPGESPPSRAPLQVGVLLNQLKLKTMNVFVKTKKLRVGISCN